MMQSLPYELLPGFYEVTMDQIMLYILKWGWNRIFDKALNLNIVFLSETFQ
jgi:hypothetical protein